MKFEGNKSGSASSLSFELIKMLANGVAVYAT
jgi:hypothetical protein